MSTHPGSDRLHNAMHQHCTWTDMSDDIRMFCKECKHCQMAKRGLKNCGKVPLKDVETQPWRNCCADLSGPWTAHANDKDTEFHALTLVDPFASWAEIAPVKTKKAPCIRDLILNHWFRRCPRPSRFIFDQGSEFANSWVCTLLRQWCAKLEPTTVKNP